MTSVALGELLVPAQVQRARGAEYPVLSMTMHDGLVAQTERFKKRIASSDTSDYKVVKHGQLVVGFPINEGVLDFQLRHAEAVVSPAYGIWDLRDESLVDREYLKRFLKSPRAIEYYVGKMKGSTARRRSLPPAEFNAMPIPLPPLPEQRRIAAILDHADALRAKRRQVLTHLDSLTEAVFHQMFDMRRDHLPFNATCHRITVGVVIRPASHYVETGVPALRTLNVKPGRITLDDLVYFSEASNNGPLAKSRLRVGDLVIARTGKAGTTAIVPPELDGANAIDLIVATPNTDVALPVYLEALLNSETGKRMVSGQARGQIQQHFNVGSLKAASVSVPPLPLQHEFAQRVVHISRQRANLQDAALVDDALFTSLQSRAFRGEL